MRPIELPYPQEEHLGRVLAGDPVAEAYEWMVKYAKELERPLHEVVTLAFHIEGNWSEYVDNRSGRSSLSGILINPEFWKRYETFIGYKLPPRSSMRSHFP